MFELRPKSYRSTLAVLRLAWKCFVAPFRQDHSVETGSFGMLLFLKNFYYMIYLPSGVRIPGHSE